MSNLGQRKRTFSRADDEFLTAQRGLMSSREIGIELGRSEDAIRRRWRLLGLAETRKPRPVRELKPAKVSVSANDDELVAEFLATRAVTVLPPGPAAGLTALEWQFGAVRPEGMGWIAQSRRHRNRKAA